MRLVSALLMVAAMAAFGLSVFSAVRSFNAWSGDTEEYSSPAAAPRPDVAGNATGATASAEDTRLPWLPIFGAPEEPEKAEPQSVVPTAPAEFNYRLRGVIASGDTRSAILSGEGGEILAQEGDVLDDARIIAIHAESIDVELDGKTLTVSFAQDVPIETARLDADEIERAAPKNAPDTKTVTKPPPQNVIFQTMSREDLLKVLREAEKRRKERGLVPKSRE